MDKTQFALIGYFRQIRRALPCSFPQKRGILRCIRQAVSGYRVENPNATIRDIRQHFGTPEEIAAAYVDKDDPTTFLDKLRKRRVFFRMSACAAAIVFAFSLFWTSHIISYNIETATNIVVIHRRYTTQNVSNP